MCKNVPLNVHKAEKKNICVSYNMSENLRVGRSIIFLFFIFFLVLKNAQEWQYSLPLTGERGLERYNVLLQPFGGCG